MKTGFYPKLAWTGIRKNRQVYLPYILTCTGMAAMYYILSYLSVMNELDVMAGGNVMAQILGLGCGVLSVFAFIFLFYTNSFLIRRRKKEFGLYNILGMGKPNLVRIQLWESIMIAFISLTAGILCGIALSKLVELVVLNVIRAEIAYSFSVPAAAVISTLKVFGVIFLFLFINSVRQIHVTNPIALLHSESVGEKRPKANWFLALLGAVLLGIAYYLAVTIKSPVTALVVFFIAVIMVILATYLLFIAGSVTVCFLLKKNKRYYYKTRHFVSVSSMLYRMKRNGAGLASICILSTMVLVMVSTTTCLYAGIEDNINRRLGRDIQMDYYSVNDDIFAGEQEKIKRILESKNKTAENSMMYHSCEQRGYFLGNRVVTYFGKLESGDLVSSESYEMYFVPLSDYNGVMGENETLDRGECIVYSPDGFEKTVMNFDEFGKMKVKKQADEFPGSESAVMGDGTLYICTGDEDYQKLVKLCGEYLEKNGGDRTKAEHIHYGFDLDGSDEEELQIYKELQRKLKGGDVAVGIESKVSLRADFYHLYGSLFVFGILLGTVFLAAMILIMYYKQVSEGYEDRERFTIMQKVGMTKQEIRSSINSQVLTVFFLPLFAAGLHLLFAFPIVSKMLALFACRNTVLIFGVTLCCYLAFALLYVVVYYITSHSYYRLVSNGSGRIQ